MKNENRQKSYQRLTVIILVLLIVLLGGTYAFLTQSLKGAKTSNVIIGNLSLKLKDDTTDGIYLDNAYPVADSVGLTYDPYSFSLTNNGNIESSYTIYLDDEELSSGEVRMNDEFVKYNLVKNGIRGNSKFLSESTTAEGRVLDSGVLSVGQTNEYDLRLWIDENVENDVMTTVFSGRIRIEAEQIKE